MQASVPDCGADHLETMSAAPHTPKTISEGAASPAQVGTPQRSPAALKDLVARVLATPDRPHIEWLGDEARFVLGQRGPPPGAHASGARRCGCRRRCATSSGARQRRGWHRRGSCAACSLRCRARALKWSPPPALPRRPRQPPHALWQVAEAEQRAEVIRRQRVEITRLSALRDDETPMRGPPPKPPGAQAGIAVAERDAWRARAHAAEAEVAELQAELQWQSASAVAPPAVAADAEAARDEMAALRVDWAMERGRAAAELEEQRAAGVAAEIAAAVASTAVAEARMEVRLSEATAALDELQHGVAAANASSAKLEAQLHVEQARGREASDAHRRAEGELESALAREAAERARVAEAEAHVQQLTAEAREARDSVRIAQEQAAQSREAAAAAEEATAAEQERVRAAEAELQQLSARLAAADAEVLAAHERESAVAAAHKAAHGRLEAEVQQLGGRATAAEALSAELAARLEVASLDAQAEHAALEAALGEAQAKCALLAEEQGELMARLEGVLRVIGSSEPEVAELGASGRGSPAMAARLTAERHRSEQLAAENERLARDLCSADGQIRTLTAALALAGAARDRRRRGRRQWR